MTERTLREKIEALAVSARDEGEVMFNRAIYQVLDILDAHTAAQPAPDAVAEAAKTEAAAIAELMRKAAEDLCQIVMKSATEYNIPQMALGAKACRDGIRDLRLDEIAKEPRP